MGVSESLKHDLLDEYPVLIEKDDNSVVA